MKKIAIIICTLVFILNPRFLVADSDESWNFLNFNAQSVIPKFSIDANVRELVFSRYEVSGNYNVDSIVSNIVARGDFLFFLDNKSNLVIFSLSNKKVLQRFKIPNHASDEISGIAMDEDYLYISFTKGILASFSLISKTIAWEEDLLNIITSAPVVYNNKVFVIAYNKVISLDKYSGKPSWSVLGSKIGVSTKKLNIPSVYGGFVWAGLFSSDVLVLKEENGNLLWKSNLLGYNNISSVTSNPLLGDIKSSIIIDDNVALAISNYKATAFDAITGETLWSLSGVNSHNTPIIINNLAYITDINGNLLQINMKKGKIIWKTQLVSLKNVKEKVYWFAPIVINNLLVVSSSVGDLIVASPANGDIISNLSIYKNKKEKLFNFPIVFKGKLIFLSSKGNLYISQN